MGDFSGFQISDMPKSANKKFPFAYIKNWKWETKSQLNFTLLQVSPGKIHVLLVNEEGRKLQDIVPEKLANPGFDETIRFTIWQDYLQTTKRLLVFHDGKMVHWQELN